MSGNKGPWNTFMIRSNGSIPNFHNLNHNM